MLTIEDSHPADPRSLIIPLAIEIACSSSTARWSVTPLSLECIILYQSFKRGPAFVKDSSLTLPPMSRHLLLHQLQLWPAVAQLEKFALDFGLLCSRLPSQGRMHHLHPIRKRISHFILSLKATCDRDSVYNGDLWHRSRRHLSLQRLWACSLNHVGYMHHVIENATKMLSIRENFSLVWKCSPSRFHNINAWQSMLTGDLLRPKMLLDSQRIVWPPDSF